MDKQGLKNYILRNLTFPDRTLDHVVEYFEEMTITKNDFFLREGTVNDRYFFLQSGFMRAFTFDSKGNEITTNFYQRDSVVLEVSSFYLKTKSTESIQAVTDCTGYSITYDQLNMLLHAIPEFRAYGVAMLAKEYVLFKKRSLDLINLSGEARYENFISSNKEIFQHAQLKQIASYLNVTDTSLSRIRREFSKKNSNK
ncbi:cAMP-binding domain of CRP or a regulatory subunit of cAMP-dependent protein kinases [Chryseolinea serpens]|uniref:cAMP-binding domain of CRP or a regulatory subunit of cAMP-dependent protein kinases n=1 Tax=Chryseolinea serpens TaxID=947013 RepID=A0A1M5JVM6_9BACT|nr:Crp/Fnr family transcriptional regulator [Chryseolinea serpens]SHG44594.1 cAMP-binding domain of CRP or a regulatory subunit of cAMP-dependent protein kinases [Chryseolinea serpens]